MFSHMMTSSIAEFERCVHSATNLTPEQQDIVIAELDAHAEAMRQRAATGGSSATEEGEDAGHE